MSLIIVCPIKIKDRMFSLMNFIFYFPLAIFCNIETIFGISEEIFYSLEMG